MTIELFLRGDQIATYSSLSTQGNSNGIQVQIQGVQTLGSAGDTFRIVVRQVNSGQTAFQNGQFVDIYAWPDTVPPSPPVYSNLNPQHDQFQGRASSAEHMVFTNQKIIFDLNGLTNGYKQYGPGDHPPREQQLPFENIPSVPPAAPCFTAGTCILTPSGERPIETLVPGDLVITLDHGPQPLRWVGSRKVAGSGAFAPVLFAPFSLGNTRPVRVSPQHRMLLSDWRADLWFGTREVLAAAQHLVNGRNVIRTLVPWVTYFHIALDRHELVLANGIPCETLHLGRMGLAAMDADQREELLALFPVLFRTGSGRCLPTARRCLRRWEVDLLTAEPDPRDTSGQQDRAAVA